MNQDNIRQLITSLCEGQFPSMHIMEQVFSLGGKTWNKDQVVKEIAHEVNFSQRDVQIVVDSFVRILNKVLAGGDKALISGLGRFEMQRLGAKQIQHPRTGEIIHAPERYIPRLKSSPIFRQNMNAYEDIEKSPQETSEMYKRMNNVKDFLNHKVDWIKDISISLIKRVMKLAIDVKTADKFDQEFARMLWRVGFGDPTKGEIDSKTVIKNINKLLAAYNQPSLENKEIDRHE